MKEMLKRYMIIILIQLFHDKIKNIKKEFKIHPEIQDIISTFYYLRKHFDISSLSQMI